MINGLVCDLPERDIPPVLDPDQVAGWLRLSSGRQVLELARRQVLPSVKIGKRILFRRDGILKSLENAEIPAITDDELGGAK